LSVEATDIEATMLLCDAAHAVGGKLYVLGGGWSILQKVQPRANMSLAVKLSVPWSRTNERIHIEGFLITDYGEEVSQADGAAIRAEGDMELGRPPGLRPGTPLDATFVLDFQGLDLQPGGYVWELRLGGKTASRIAFQVIQPPGALQA
jgi:hypothetical protein